jgi:hypothetical protein
MLYDIEWTDVYASEANYTWVDRHQVDGCNMGHAITLAKQYRYHSPVPRHNKQDYGDTVRIDIVGSCVCAFITLAKLQPEPVYSPEEHAKAEFVCLDVPRTKEVSSTDYLKPTLFTKDEEEAGLDKRDWCGACASWYCSCIDRYA